MANTFHCFATVNCVPRFRLPGNSEDEGYKPIMFHYLICSGNENQKRDVRTFARSNEVSVGRQKLQVGNELRSPLHSFRCHTEILRLTASADKAQILRLQPWSWRRPGVGFRLRFNLKFSPGRAIPRWPTPPPGLHPS